MVYPWDSDEDQFHSSGIMQAMTADDHIQSWQEDYDIGALDKIAIAVKAGLYGMANNFIQIGNAFGAENEVYDIGEELDDSGDQGDYYRANKATYDIAGDVITSFIPGLGAMKAIKLAKKGMFGNAALKGSTYFENKSKVTAEEITALYDQLGDAAQVGGLKRSVFRYETAQQAAEGAIIGVATEAALNLGDIVNQEGVGFLEKVGQFATSSLVWGAMVPAPIIAGFTYHSTLAPAKSSLRQFRLEAEDFTPKTYNIRPGEKDVGKVEGDLILNTLSEYKRIDSLPTGDREGLQSVKQDSLISLETTLNEQVSALLPKNGDRVKADEIKKLKDFMSESIKTEEGRQLVADFVTGSKEFKPVSTYQLGAKAEIDKLYSTLKPEVVPRKELDLVTSNNYAVVKNKDGSKKLLVNDEYKDDLNVRFQAAAHYSSQAFLDLTKGSSKVSEELKLFKDDAGLADDIDEYELMTSMYSAYKVAPKEFKLAHPKISSYLKKMGDDADILYGRTEIKYLDTRTGDITVAPMTHLGDMGGLTVLASGKQISFETGEGAVNISKIQIPDIGKTKDLLQYQGLRVLASQDVKGLSDLTNLDTMTIEQGIRLEKVIIDTLNSNKLETPEFIEFNVNRKPIQFPMNDAIRAVVKSKVQEADRLLKDAESTGVNLVDVANTVGLSKNVLENMGIVTDDIIEEMLDPMNGRELRDMLRSTDELMDRRTFASIQTLNDVKSPAEDGYVMYSETKRSNLLQDLKIRASNIIGLELEKQLPEFKIDVTTDNLNTRRFLQDAATTGETLGIETATARIGDWLIKQADERFNVDILPRLQQSASSLSLNKNALAEMAAFEHWYTTRPEKYVQVEEGLWLDSDLVADYSRRIEEGAASEQVLSRMVQGRNYYKLKNQETINYVNNLQNLNNKYVSGPQVKIEQAYGNKVERDSKHLYLPPNNFKHVTYIRVRAGSPLDNHSSTMLRVTGVDADDLTEKVAAAMKYGADKGWEKIERADVQKYTQARGVFEWSGKDITGTVANSMMKRRSETPDIFPTVDPNKILVDHANWFKRQNKFVHQSAVEMHYADNIASLNHLIDREQANTRSFFDEVPGFRRLKGQATPEKNKPGNYEVLRNQMLGIDDSGFSAWKIANNTVETWAAKAFNPVAKAIRTIRKKDLSSAQWDEHIDLMERELKENGIGTPFKDLMRKQLSKEQNLNEQDIIQAASKLNFIQSMLLLRTDQADSLVNVLGYATKAGAEITALNQMVARSSQQVQTNYDVTVRELFGMGNKDNIGINAFGVGKAIGVAIKEMHSPKGKANIERWKEDRLLTDADTINRDLFEEVQITPADLVTEKAFSKYREKLNKVGKKAIKAATFFNDKSNILGQYSSLMIAENLGKAAGLEGGQLRQFMFAFNRRTNVLSTPTQKPRLFQGAVGVAISLYQSYVFHTLANMFRYAEQGATKAPLVFNALNTTFFGAKSIPGFEYMNHQIGMSQSENGNVDLYGAAHAMFDDDVANFLLYGAGSTLLQSNIHTRGDLNPRNATLIPTDLADIPVANTMMNVTSSVVDNAAKFINGTQGIGQTIWNTLADTGLSRPLTGLTTIAEGRSVDSNHATVMFHNDIVDITTPMRLAGLKPFNEQFVRDYQFRTKRYNIANNKRKKNLGEDIRLMYENDPTQFEDDGFVGRLADKYVNSGGSLDRFDTFLEDSLIKSNYDLSVRIEDDISSNASAMAQYKLFMQGGD